MGKEEMFSAGGGEIIKSDVDEVLKEQTPSADVLAEKKEGDTMDKKLIEFLEQKEILHYSDNGEVVFDFNKLEEYKKDLFRLYLGRVDGKMMQGGIKKINDLLSDLAIKGVDKLGKEKAGTFNELYKGRIEVLAPKENVFSILEKKGVIERKKGKTIVDIELLKKVFSKDNGIDISRTNKNRIKFTVQNVYNILGDILVISKDDYEKSLKEKTEPEEKPLFNVPESVEDAFDVDNIKNKKYVLNIWDIHTRVPWHRLNIKAKDGEEIWCKEFQIATEIFRNFKGKRDEHGGLVMFDETKGDFVRISSEKLMKAGLIRAGAGGVRNFLSKKCPNLLKYGLIKVDDFNIITNSEFSGDIYRKEFTSNNPKKPFTAMINSVNYYIGRKYFIHNKEKIPIENIKVVPLDNDRAGIIKIHGGREEIVYTFDLLNKEEKSKKREEVGKKHGNKLSSEISARTSIKKKELVKRIHKYSHTDFIPIDRNESSADYAKRISELPNYGYVQKVTNELSKKIGVGIHNLSWREQLQIAQMEYESGVLAQNDDFMSFAKKHKLQGLRTFLSLEHGGQKMGEKILSIGSNEKLDQKSIDAIFAKYGELVNYAQNSAEYLTDQFNLEDNKKQSQGIAEHLLRRAKALLVVCADNDFDTNQINKKLNSIRGEMEIFVATLKTIKDAGEKIDFEVVRDLKIQKKVIQGEQGLGSTEKEEVKKIFIDTYGDIFADNQEACQRVVSDFESQIDNLDGQIVYMMKYKNKVVAFCRFDPISDSEVLGGSLVAREDIRGLNVGGYFIKNTLAEVSSTHDVFIKSRKDNVANDNYKKLGFVVTGEHTENDVEYYDMVMPSKNKTTLKEAA